jgi:hypothetical protein
MWSVSRRVRSTCNCTHDTKQHHVKISCRDLEMEKDPAATTTYVVAARRMRQMDCLTSGTTLTDMH